jgi:hypothetical protein
MKGGLKAGANISRIIVTKSGNLPTDASYSSRTAFHAGSYFQQSINEHLLWQIELLFSNKGYKMEVGGETTDVSLNYLNWPILIVYRPFNVVEFEFGPELGYMISGEEMMNGFDFGFDFGTRFNISEKLNVGLRYSYGLPFNMNVKNAAKDAYNSTYQNSVFQFYFGFNLISE